MVEQMSKLDSLASIDCRCGGSISFCEDEDGGAVVIHTMPFCEWFEKATIDDYRGLLEAHPDARRAVMNRRDKSLS